MKQQIALVCMLTTLCAHACITQDSTKPAETQQHAPYQPALKDRVEQFKQANPVTLAIILFHLKQDHARPSAAPGVDHTHWTRGANETFFTKIIVDTQHETEPSAKNIVTLLEESKKHTNNAPLNETASAAVVDKHTLYTYGSVPGNPDLNVHVCHSTVHKDIYNVIRAENTPAPWYAFWSWFC